MVDVKLDRCAGGILRLEADGPKEWIAFGVDALLRQRPGEFLGHKSASPAHQFERVHASAVVDDAEHAVSIVEAETGVKQGKENLLNFREGMRRDERVCVEVVRNAVAIVVTLNRKLRIRCLKPTSLGADAEDLVEYVIPGGGRDATVDERLHALVGVRGAKKTEHFVDDRRVWAAKKVGHKRRLRSLVVCGL